MNTLEKTADLAGRALLSLLFIAAGASKITGYAGTQAYMASAGVPGALLPLVILTELGGGLAILAGFQTRLVALALAGFSVVSAALFHANFADPIQQIMFMKNLSLAGAFLFVAARGAGPWSLDRRGR